MAPAKDEAVAPAIMIPETGARREAGIFIAVKTAVISVLTIPAIVPAPHQEAGCKKRLYVHKILVRRPARFCLKPEVSPCIMKKIHHHLFHDQQQKDQKE